MAKRTKAGRQGLRHRIFTLMGDHPLEKSNAHWAVTIFSLAGILSCAVAVVLTTVPGMDEAMDGWNDRVREGTDLLFTLEFALRIWIAPEYARNPMAYQTHSRIRYLRSFLGIADLLVILPFWINILVPIPRDMFLALEILTLLKLARYAPGLGLIGTVLRREAKALFAAFLSLIVLLIIASSFMYVLEHEAQPQAFASIPHALWWGIVTMGTVGYGDVVPLTNLGKFFGGFVVLLGLATFAIPSGLMASGFAEEIRRREFVVTWHAVATLPIFSGLDASSIAEIANILKPMEMPAGTMIVRKGEKADAMFFIMQGEVEVNLHPHPIILREGSYFGEIALIRATERTATVIAASRCRLLALEVDDFRRLLHAHPVIKEQVEKIAHTRHAERVGADHHDG